jgi:hypothetical protein
LEADYNAVARGTVQHEILEGRTALAFSANDSLAIDVDCRILDPKLATPVRYGLIVSLEMAASIRADLYSEVRQGLRIQMREKIAAQAR